MVEEKDDSGSTSGKRARRAATPTQHQINEFTTARWTRQVGIFTVILALCAVGNCYLIYRQLSEMHSGGIDTHKLADATSKLGLAAENQTSDISSLANATAAAASAAQSEASSLGNLRVSTERLRLAAQDQAITTHSLSDLARRQLASIQALAGEAKDQATALSDQAASQRETLTSTVRPRIVATLQPDGPLEIKDGRASMSVKVHLRNKGNVEAQMIGASVMLLPADLAMQAEEQLACDEAQADGAQLTKSFKGLIPPEHTGNLEPGGEEELSKEPDFPLDKLAEFPSHNPDLPGKLFLPALVTCVTYISPTDHSPHFSTSILLMLHKNKDGVGELLWAHPGTVPIVSLEFRAFARSGPQN